MSEMTMLVDVTKCVGCYSCRVACQMENDLPPEQSYIQFREVERGSFPDVSWHMQRFSCLHCSDAVCEKVCPQDAIGYSPSGAVVVDQDACVGCRYCEKNCPFGVAHVERCVNADGDTQLVANKCTQCDGRVSDGGIPVCVSTCYTGAMAFGERSEMLQEAERRLQEVKARYPDAMVYNPEGLGGTHTIFLLPEGPEAYRLEANPVVPLQAMLWKDYAQPLGKALLGFTTMAVIGGAISNRLFNKADHDEEEGESQ